MNIPGYYVAAIWILWILVFALFRPKQKATPVVMASAARWGILFQALGYWAIFMPGRRLLVEPLALWRLIAGVAFGIASIWLASAGIRHLGKQWRVNAALNADHELITSGPYRIVRHPIYASMFAMNIMSALMIGVLPWWPLGVALFLVGIEIRVRVEDNLLRGRFGSRFEEWRKLVPAYLPGIR